MTLLERYVFKAAFGYAAGSLASLVLIVWIVQALSRIDIIKTTASAAGNIFWIALMLLPGLVAGVLPFAVLIGAIQALNSLNAGSERAVISAAGASPKVVTRPILLLGAIAGLIILFLSHVVGPYSSSSFQNGLRSINADTLTLFLQPGRFERVQDDLVVSVGDANGAVIESLFISDTRDPTVDLTYFAREARVVDDGDRSNLLLYDGQLHRRSTTDGGVSVIEFQTYAFDLAELRPSSNGDWTRTSERSTVDLLFPDPNDPIFQSKPLNLVEEFTDRMSSWLYAIAFALWAVVVAGDPRTNRQGTGPAMFLGLAGGLVLKALGFVALSLIEEGYVWVFVSYLLPLGAIAANIFLIWRGLGPANWPLSEWTAVQMDRVTAMLTRFRPASYQNGDGR
ncbi:LptF/LptG family permease [Aurantimonas sp. HBX-1]|uniref:LptF/LptG family permease n=1 Tax=Aurantimonas sp. HBX-1 TaxID=2906072 RepID=UPI001F29F845|nr:LptF/LptG family permease [Aurantimonas sp. HBX-1]UIJ70291.1 LptF/LptG family permease [Aurantimonas sp. HBX-1]